ncbi:hypothetical protein H6G54_05265 [Anabaena cylindrica FACHB-243]|uniref:Uncharacterized protein n=1 Tax=Anabaena cylindrica (strain ATCC 27899 / PCC 7122) TaxID=272123 RepID=K9ZNQ9_ANACC|nr:MULTISPECIES: hypothetical protein [Anabaena]AFZ60831.1 hypothetical protein Anacy_5519 [Anabaena cylindrica PCC 7122]MBD2417129.1 hypothetical protein [Anabaena cylindrica FACHB-243]MBY5280825.1 hypothetical protein [Anabaena sp. CCAP 1446/1C]MBY5307101.1 hypothetical protein [Anabaena sp. CCAP 1446/1C]MCM2406830.1 hypothetical protein [Anabaena sp. CCAP 1446/1C]
MLITQTGFITKQDKINKFVKSAKVKQLKLKLANIIKNLPPNPKDYSASDWGTFEDCQDYIESEFKEVEIQFLEYLWQNETGYNDLINWIVARISEAWCFESSYLSASLGATKAKICDELGMKDDHIKEYQEIWREFGCEPTLANYDWTGYYGEQTMEDVTVEDLEREVRERLLRDQAN